MAGKKQSERMARMRAERDIPALGVKRGQTFDVTDAQSGRLRSQGLAKRMGFTSEFKDKAENSARRGERPAARASGSERMGRTADSIEGRAASSLDPETRANANARTPGGTGGGKAADRAAAPKTTATGGPTRRTRGMKADATADAAESKPKRGRRPGVKTGTYNRRDMRAK